MVRLPWQREEGGGPPAPRGVERSYILAVDLGQSADYTGIVAIQRTAYAGAGAAEGPSATAGPVSGEPPPADYVVRLLERPALKTPYPAIVRRLRELLAKPPLDPARTPVVYDATGVGAAVGDLLAEAVARPVGITISGGDRAHGGGRAWSVPKRDLTGVLLRLFQTGRLRIAERLRLAPVLVSELDNFKMKVNLATGRDSYAAWREGQHDDLVLACALGCWWGELPRPRIWAVRGAALPDWAGEDWGL
jgi:hypothetical protein